MVEGRVAVITGAAMGLGKQFALELSNGGAKIVIADLDEAKGRHMEKELKDAGKESLYVNVNVLNEDSVKQMAKTVMDRYSRIDILVNSEGVTQDKAIEDIAMEDWDFVVNSNLRGPYLCTKYILPIMKRQRYGRIVNISSIAAKMGGGFVGTSHYAASQAGIIGFTVATAKESAAYGVTANAISPGPCRTHVSAPWLSEHEEELARSIPIPRVGEPEDIANAVLFLASYRSGYITGQTLTVDGGLTTIGKIIS